MSETDLNALAERLEAAADHLGEHDMLAPDLRQAAQAIRGMGEALQEIADGSTPMAQHGHYLAHRAAVDRARSALKGTGGASKQP